ncbi:MAG: 50S ribosomal protein L9 [Kiloniellales bacterium]
MDVILLERIERLGQMGDVVTVKAGYARNYLLPRRKALRATKANLERFEEERAALEAHNLERRSEAEAVAAKLDGLMIVLIRQAGEGGQLYGSVTARDVAERLAAAGFAVDRHQVQIERPIKELGLHDIRVLLHPEVSVTATANVAPSEEVAAMQAKAAAEGEPPAAPPGGAEAPPGPPPAAETQAGQAETEETPAGKAAKKRRRHRTKAG